MPRSIQLNLPEQTADAVLNRVVGWAVLASKRKWLHRRSAISGVRGNRA